MSRYALIDADVFPWYILPNKNIKDNNGNIIGKEEDKSLEVCCEMLDSFVSNILDITKADGYIMAVTYGRCFRYNIASSYKANRVGMEKPKLFNELRQYMNKKYNTVYHNDLEADDIISICKKNIEGSFIISPDKDLIYGIAGTHYNPKTNKWIETLLGEANNHLFKQMIVGDASDRISGLKGRGIKFFENLLLDNTSILAMCPVEIKVFWQYISDLGNDLGIKEYYKNYQLLKILDEYEGFVLPEIQKIENKEYERAI